MTTDNLPVLIDINQRNNDLILRLDTDSISESIDENCILLIELNGCYNPTQVLQELKQGVGKVLEYEPANTEGLHFYINYSWDMVEVNCQSWEEIRTRYTESDLLARSKYLAQWYRVYVERYEKFYRQYRELVDGLKREISDQVDRSYKKLEFFRTTNPAKTEAVEATIEVYKRIENLLESNQIIK